MSNLKKIRFVDVINPKKWFVMIDYWLSKRYTSFEYCEQVVYRSIMCSPCLQNGSCTHCGCASPGNFLPPDNWCSAQNWAPMLDKEDWNGYKEHSKLKFKVTINE